MSISQLLCDKRSEILNIALKYGANKIRIFGSMARGKTRPESNIDILVEMKEGRSLLDIIAIKQDIEDLLGRKVDIVTEASISPYVREEVLKEAVPL